ncbi:ATP-binding protein [Streptomyces marianii]|uniref:ATP-binding protein n=1 Tax=Streptomyces marianii TaxID=1817406 RepID=A0A5R9E3V9_9ACTN|nr:ATP-binding protein [Streptomyces marianii]TLQ43735.1 ATP-binding protein [Streptomyces marianii]
MTNNPTSTAHPTQPTTSAHHFEMRFTSTPRGARLARRLCAERLHAWGLPYGTEEHDAVTLLVAELSANAVHHGRVPGRDFLVRLTVLVQPLSTVRIEVADTRGERLPEPAEHFPGPDRTDGRGLLLVAALADRWGWGPRLCAAPGKVVWAEYDRRNLDAQTVLGQM